MLNTKNYPFWISWSISFSLKKKTSLSHDQLLMIFIRCGFDPIRDTLDQWIGYKGISTFQCDGVCPHSCTFFDDIIFNFNSGSKCDSEVIKSEFIFLWPMRWPNVRQVNRLGPTSLIVQIGISFFKEIEDIILILSFRISLLWIDMLTERDPFFFWLLDGFIDLFFDQ